MLNPVPQNPVPQNPVPQKTAPQKTAQQNPAQQSLVKQAIALSKTIPLGEAYCHVNSSAVLADFQARLANTRLTQQSLSLYALGTLAGDGQPNEADWRRLLALSKTIIRAQKTRQRLGQTQKT